jgi:hypothetical protein
MAKKLAKKDYDKDGKVESPSEEYKGVKTKAIKKAKSKKAKSKKVLKDSVEISQFITAVSSKNYAQANKYLKGIIEAKLQNRINSALNEPLF